MMTIIDRDGNVRRVPVRIGLALNGEMDEQDYLDSVRRARAAQVNANPHLARLEVMHEYIKKAHADMRYVLKDNLTAAERARVFEIAETLHNFEEDIRQLSFEHALREGY